MELELAENESRIATDELLTGLVRAKVFDSKDYQQILRLTGMVPDKLQWLRFLYGFVFSLGTVFLLLGIILFFAWNWSDLGAYQKLILVEGILILSAICSFITRGKKLTGQLSVTIMCVMTGVVLAVYGQIYQTGADNYRLFTSWTLLILIPVMMVRFAPLWLFWVALMNLGLVLWATQTSFGGHEFLRLGLILGGANVTLFLIWSLYIYSCYQQTPGKFFRKLKPVFRLFIPINSQDKPAQNFASEMQLWMFRILYSIGLTWLTITLFQLLAQRSFSAFNTATWIMFIVPVILLYVISVSIAQFLAQRVLKDMFIYTLSLFSACSLVCIFFAKEIELDRHNVWLLALFVIFLAAATAHWLRKVQQNWKID